MERFLVGISIFKHLLPSERQYLASVSVEKRYAKGDTIFRAGEMARSVYIVKDGRVHLMKFLENGQASTTCVMTEKELFCCLPSLVLEPFPVDAIAAVDSVVVRIPISAFHELLHKNP